MSKSYFANEGFFENGTVYVEEFVAGTDWDSRIYDVTPLPLHLNVSNHSPTGFAWGYGGSGPAQLALAILVDLVGPERAKPAYMEFKWRVIAKLDQDKGWELSELDIMHVLEEIEADKKGYVDA